jgi:hypothetical protein
MKTDDTVGSAPLRSDRGVAIAAGPDWHRTLAPRSDWKRPRDSARIRNICGDGYRGS